MTLPTLDPLPTQREFLRLPTGCDYDICYYQGGVGSGKSFIAAFKGVLQCLLHPERNGMVLGPTIKDIQATVWQSYGEVFALMGLVDGEDYKFHGDDYLQFYDGNKNPTSRIYWRATAQPERWRSMQVAWANIEEASVCLTRKSFEELVSRVRQGPGPYLIFMQANPAQYDGVLAELFAPDKLGFHEIEGSRYLFRMLQAPTSENVHLSTAYRGLLQHLYDDLTYRRMVLGESVQDPSGRVCHNFSDANVDPNLAYNKNLPLYLSCDFNVDPMSWVVAQRVDREYHFIDEIVVDNCGTDVAAEVFFERWGANGHPARMRPLIICGDASGGNRSTQIAGQYGQLKKTDSAIAGNYRILLNALVAAGWKTADKNIRFDLRSANPLISNRVQAWNSLVCNKAGVMRIKVHPRCKRLIWNMYNFKFRPGGGQTMFSLPTTAQILKNPDLKHTGHIFDAASYLVERYDPITNTTNIKQQRVIERVR
jgi:Phage terminase large subunit